MIIGTSESVKVNALVNLINHQLDIDKIFSHAKDPCESKYQYFIKMREEVVLKHFKGPKIFTEYSNDMTSIEE